MASTATAAAAAAAAIQRVLAAQDLTVADLPGLGVAVPPSDAAVNKLRDVNDAKRALRHLVKSVAVLSARCEQVLARIDDSTKAIHTAHDRFVELGRVREELQRRTQAIDSAIAVCDGELKAGVRHRPPPIEVEPPNEDELSPWDETPVNSPMTGKLRKSPHQLLRSAANSVDYSSPRSSLGSVNEDVLVHNLLTSSMDTLMD